MIEHLSFRKAWALLDAQERRNAWIVLGIMMISALFAAISVGSVMPFLAVLADPSRIETTPILARIYTFFGFTSVYYFTMALGCAAFVVIVVGSVLQIVKTWAVSRYSRMRAFAISKRLMANYLAQPYMFFLDNHSGTMGPRVLTEAPNVVARFMRPFAEFVASILTTVAIVGLLLWVNPVVALSAFTVLGGVYAVIYFLTRIRLNRYGKLRVLNNRLRFRFANEALNGIKDIKLAGQELSYLDRYASPSSVMAHNEIKVDVISQVPKFALQAIALGGVILLCIIMIDEESMRTGAGLGDVLPVLGVFAFAGLRLLPELSRLYGCLANMQAGTASLDVVYEDFITKGRGATLPARQPAALGLTERLELEGICYTYPNSEGAGLRDIFLTIRAGEKIGIVGTTGAGKSTLADIILGLLSPSQGRLLVDGTPIDPKNVRAWMRSVGYVPQEIFLTDAPVCENIALGIRPDKIDMDRLHRAARIARIDHFITEELPDGYQTHIGERGIRLSGGQRQRLGIARALYHDADLIVFDEATSALDNLTEKDVMEAIDALPGDKTVLMIAHRLSTVKRCDRIVVLERGMLVGCDSWDALMAENDAFQRIARVAESA